MSGLADPEQSRFEARVLDAARNTILAYCREALAAYRPAELAALRLKITITISSVRQILLIDEELRTHAARAFARDLYGAQLAGVDYLIDGSLTGQGYWIGIEPHLYSGPATVPTEPHRVAAPPVDTVELTLGYGTQDAMSHRLPAADVWLPLGRKLPDYTSIVPIRLPEFFRAVPRGGLLRVRYWNGRVEMRRTYERDDYGVVVDGRELVPGDQITCGADGRIEYRHRATNAYSVLTYQASQEH